MKRLILIAATVAALAAPAQARDYWNGSGFSLDHNFHSPYDNMFGRHSGYSSQGARAPTREQAPVEFNSNRTGVEVVDSPVTHEEREKAIADERKCDPVVITGDEGRIVHKAQGCIR